VVERNGEKSGRKEKGERGSATCVCVCVCVSCWENIRLSSPSKPGANTWYGISFIFKALNFYKSLQDPIILKSYLLTINIKPHIYSNYILLM
jgi:hypothetical protein